jgi:hypothetical protein
MIVEMSSLDNGLNTYKLFILFLAQLILKIATRDLSLTSSCSSFSMYRIVCLSELSVYSWDCLL